LKEAEGGETSGGRFRKRRPRRRRQRRRVADAEEQALVALPPPADGQVHVLEPPPDSAAESDLPRRHAQHQPVPAPGLVVSGHLPQLDDHHRHRGGNGSRFGLKPTGSGTDFTNIF
jgi:hypothetical protein